MVTEKSQEAIERITELVSASNLHKDIKPFVIGYIKGNVTKKWGIPAQTHRRQLKH